MSDDDISGSFSIPEEGERGPAMIAANLVKTDDALFDLKEGEPLFLFLMREESRYVGDKVELGSMHLPMFQGRLGPVARWLLAKLCDGLPDYIMILDAQFWLQATMEQRRALVFHELLHAGIETDRDGLKKFTADGRPKWCVRPHDLEAFNLEVARYGAWAPDILGFLKAAREGGAI
jgi:hypothetical protein